MDFIKKISIFLVMWPVIFLASGDAKRQKVVHAEIANNASVRLYSTNEEKRELYEEGGYNYVKSRAYDGIPKTSGSFTYKQYCEDNLRQGTSVALFLKQIGNKKHTVHAEKPIIQGQFIGELIEPEVENGVFKNHDCNELKAISRCNKRINTRFVKVSGKDGKIHWVVLALKEIQAGERLKVDAKSKKRETRFNPIFFCGLDPYKSYDTETEHNELFAYLGVRRCDSNVPHKDMLPPNTFALNPIDNILDNYNKGLPCFHDKISQQLRDNNPPQLTIKLVNKQVGLGVFAQGNIKKGTLLGEYTGMIVTFAQVRENGKYAWEYGLRKEPSKNDPHSCVLFSDHTASEYLIDASAVGGVLRFVNDKGSKSNAFTMQYSERGNPSSLKMLYIAEKDIAQGEEITVDYGEDYWKNRKRG